MIGRALLAIPAMLVPPAAPPEQPLDVVSIDASAYPEVLIEVVVPPKHTGDEITAQKVELDGAPVASVTPVDPANVIVGLVIDDGPAVAPSVVTALQGGAVELVRNARSGIRIALRTPSGLQSALTADRGANIARIAGIIAGAPAVVPLPEVVLDAVAALVTDPAGDRQAVVVLGGPFEATDAQVNDLASLVADSGTTLHLVTPAGVEAPALARIVKKSGGVIAASRVLSASIDRVTAVISNRYLIGATLAEAGAHQVGLTVDGERFGAEIDVPAPPSQPTSPPTTRPSTTTSPRTSPTTSPTTARTVPSSSVAVAPPATAAPASAVPTGEQRAGSSIAATVLLLVAVAVVGAAVLIFVRRWRGRAPPIMSTEADRLEAARTSIGRLLLTVAVAASVGGLGWLIAYALDAFDPEGATSTGFPLVGDDDESLRRPTNSRPEVSASLATTSPTATSTTTVATATTTTTTSTTTTTTKPTMTAPQPQPSPVPTSTEVVPPTLSALPTYSTLPDGSPVPVLATFDVDTITLSGAVPSQAAADRLAALALANSKTPATVVSSLTIDPAVPLNVGVRVLELTSTRFPPGSAEIRPAHALEFDRVAAIMNALPNITVLVVGHADQRGSDASNFELSTARAQTVVDYLVALGVSPSRLSWRAVGESDLVSLANDETALALNRRTEFILYGLLLGG